jgi:exopolysaccharide production protein ExoZ
MSTIDNSGPAVALQSGRGRIELVEVGRGLAALAVTLLHAANGMAAPQYSGNIGFDGFFRLGFLGVDFFFVLSGFIILYVHWADVGAPQRAKRYGWRRLVRVFPTYWIILALTLAFNLAVQRDKAPIGGIWFLQQISMSAQHLWMGVAWTLQHELAFYTLFIALVLSRRIGFALLGLWFASIILLKFGVPGFYDYTLEYLDTTKTRTFLNIALHPANLNFLFGMSVAYCARKFPARMAGVVVFYASVFIAGYFAFDWQTFDWNMYWRFPWIGCGFAAVLGGLLLAARIVPDVPRAFTFLGTISYSLYLSHLLPIGIVYASLSRLGLYAQLPDALIFIFAVSSAIAFAGICFFYLEKPIIERLQKLVS